MYEGDRAMSTSSTATSLPSASAPNTPPPPPPGAASSGVLPPPAPAPRTTVTAGGPDAATPTPIVDAAAAALPQAGATVPQATSDALGGPGKITPPEDCPPPPTKLPVAQDPTQAPPMKDPTQAPIMAGGPTATPAAQAPSSFQPMLAGLTSTIEDLKAAMAAIQKPADPQVGGAEGGGVEGGGAAAPMKDCPPGMHEADQTAVKGASGGGPADAVDGAGRTEATPRRSGAAVEGALDGVMQQIDALHQQLARLTPAPITGGGATEKDDQRRPGNRDAQMRARGDVGGARGGGSAAPAHDPANCDRPTPDGPKGKDPRQQPPVGQEPPVKGGGPEGGGPERGDVTLSDRDSSFAARLESASGDYVRMYGDPHVEAVIDGEREHFTIGYGPGNISLTDGTTVSWRTYPVGSAHEKRLLQFDIDSAGSQLDRTVRTNDGRNSADLATALDEPQLEELVDKLRAYEGDWQRPLRRAEVPGGGGGTGPEGNGAPAPAPDGTPPPGAQPPPPPPGI